MATIKTFEVVVELAERQRDQARLALQAAVQKRDAAREQLDQLLGYAQETHKRWGPREDKALAPQVLFHHVRFIGRLEHAAGVQQQVVQAQEGLVAQARQTLIATEARLTGLRKVLQQRRQAHAQQLQRREQKETDELAGQRHARKVALLQEE